MSNGNEVTVVLRFPAGPESDPQRIKDDIVAAIGGIGLAGPDLRTYIYVSAAQEAHAETGQSPGESAYPDGFESDPRLGLTISEEFLADYPGTSTEMTRLQNVLGRGGAHTVRDILALGKEVLGDTINVGGRSLERIHYALNDLEIGWQDKPNMSDLVRICRGLDEVPAAVGVGRFAFKPGEHMTIGSMLETPQDELASRMAGDTQRERTAKAAEALRAAQKFAARFETVRAEYMSSRSDQPNRQ